MPVPGARRVPLSPALAWRFAPAVLAAALCWPVFADAQTAPDKSAPDATTQSQPASPATDPAPPASTQISSSSPDSLSPTSHPDATSVGIPTAAQIEAAGAQSASQDTETNTSSDPSTGNPTAATPSAPAATTATTATKPATQDPNLPPKYNVALIGQRNVGSGLDFYSHRTRGRAGTAVVAASRSRSARVITDPVVTEYVNRIGQNLVRNSDAARALHHQGARYRGGERLRAARRILLREQRADSCRR